jgi:hypothetical protein
MTEGPRVAVRRIQARDRSTALLCATLLVAGCTASYPTAPSEPVPVLLRVHIERPTDREILANGSPRSFFAYVLRSDGAWEDVTAKTAWSSPAPSVFTLIPVGSGQFAGRESGTSGVRAEYAGLAAFLEIVIDRSSLFSFPQLAILTAAGPQTAGATEQATASVISRTASPRDVTGAATWVSSDPSVATVDGGRVTAVAPGTTRITVTFEGFTDWYLFSVQPPRR